ncbi:diguanylate cyclase [Photobacterium aphoticum]|uniref:diguanylate cyclase n=1 Tax=Photobacterium aphoticum TaxID=754436 RepID=A0A0J1JK10_9GAMM|nr:GGDEF domain-containing protein [Photobacterium aphoticum]KLV02342.1 hypothetical protein ABT58_03425 [Photobacterium aphoticum]
MLYCVIFISLFVVSVFFYTQIESSKKRQQYLSSIKQQPLIPTHQYAQWREWVEQSHIEPAVVAQEVQSLTRDPNQLSDRAQGYLVAVLTNLSRKLDHDWIHEQLAQAKLQTDHIKWLPVLLSAEQAIHRWYANDKAQAIMELELLMATAIREHYEFLMPKLLYWSGYMSLSNNEVLQAQKYLLKSTYYAEQYNNVFYLSKIYHGLSLTYILMEEWEQALTAIQKARALGERWPNIDSNTLQLYWYNESVILSNLQRKQEAQAAYHKAHFYYLRDNQSLRHRILDIRGAANIAMLDQDYTLAHHLIEQCLTLSAQINYVYSMGRCNLKLARLNQAEGKYSQALDAVDASAQSFGSSHSAYSVIKALNLKAQIYESMGSSSQAYALAKTVNQAEKRQLQRKLRDLTHAQEAFELAKQRDELNAKQRANSEQLNQERLYLYWAMSTAVIIGLLVLVLVVRTQRIKRENARLAHHSSIDQLTGLHNRHYYYQQLAKGEAIASHREYHIALFDIDYFKLINDNHGHAVGDEVLQQLATQVKPWLREQELFVRWGGEEFLWLVKADASSKQRIEQVRAAIAGSPFATSVGQLVVTTSIGVSLAATPEQLLADEQYFLKADTHLYQAKRDGRNRVVW